jgi:hypothetical protein
MVLDGGPVMRFSESQTALARLALQGAPAPPPVGISTRQPFPRHLSTRFVYINRRNFIYGSEVGLLNMYDGFSRTNSIN